MKTKNRDFEMLFAIEKGMREKNNLKIYKEKSRYAATNRTSYA